MELLFSSSTALIALFAAVCLLGALHLWRDRMPAALRAEKAEHDAVSYTHLTLPTT